MAEVAIGSCFYSTFAEVEEADEYLAADMKRYSGWAALSADDKARALVTATRYLDGLVWLEPPAYDNPPQAVKEANALLAADIAAKPTLGDDSSTGSNVKRVKGGEAEVEFFRPTSGTALPSYLLRLLGGLLDSDPTWAEGGTAYGSDDCYTSRFEKTDWTLNRSYS
jgi:hypothetical protein